MKPAGIEQGSAIKKELVPAGALMILERKD
jgi:hypothetical protein